MRRRPRSRDREAAAGGLLALIIAAAVAEQEQHREDFSRGLRGLIGLVHDGHDVVRGQVVTDSGELERGSDV